jgi:hypothetical protein
MVAYGNSVIVFTLPAVLWIIGFNADPDPAFYLITGTNPDPDPGSQTNADPCGSEFGSWVELKCHKKVNFKHKKYLQ